MFDIEILEEEAHMWFRLANAYRDAGRTQEAADAYCKRLMFGGDDEESYCAALYLARCLKEMGQ
jgi:predicted TPR repeat methyltransferase